MMSYLRYSSPKQKLCFCQGTLTEANYPKLNTPYLSAPVRCASTILLKVPRRSQIMPPRPRNEKVFYPGHKETLPRWFLEKLVVPTEIEYFQHGPRSLE